ncbi:Uncharacterized protein SVXHr_0503 [Halorhabdus sp. SVX81]|uniref:hypothetical protein n=1 Tax=Halorhabdus sp. SVX81 TaxID=2978283 RepID=UPI0023DC8350|nr:hypothetical protein [Halorhabdus sp. SVX81]WEL16684.1 Uncharacterized protein SVXHr_0503 [Halorhabdus sp. SVX81]
MPERDRTTGAVDSEVLERIGTRLSGSQRFERVQYRPAYAPSSVIADYDMGYFPAGVERAYLRVSWFETDDFNVHYSEQYENGTQWECRWDRHPNDHNERAHYHLPPDAETPGEDVEYAEDWRDILSQILLELDERIESFWE